MILMDLTFKQSRILMGLCAGLSDKEIMRYADCRTRNTLSYHLKKLYKLANVNSRIEMFTKVKVLGLPKRVQEYAV